jgi:hypothetical protein
VPARPRGSCRHTRPDKWRCGPAGLKRSEATGNTRYVLNEIYESPDGIADHWQQAQASWNDFGAITEILASCDTQTLHSGEVAASLW